MGRWRSVRKPGFAVLMAVLVMISLQLSAVAAFAQRNGDQMCGDGTTTRVTLPGQDMGFDDSRGLWLNIDVPSVGPEDFVDIPNGCRIYAFLVSGYNQNADLDQMIFYSLAEFVAANDGYVHVSWWNNLLKEYMGRKLHSRVVAIRHIVAGAIVGDVEIPTAPGFGALGFVGFAPAGIDLPKANPDEDFQFVKDLAAVIKAIRDNPINDGALIVVVGHSMGANAVTHVAHEPDVEIDLLGLIDPVNNRDSPVGVPGPTFNWTRWRATTAFAGYKRWDCTRIGIFCKDVDPFPFTVRFECKPEAGNYRPTWPLITTNAPIACPIPVPYIHPGVRLTIPDARIKRLYHRWQTESSFPFDFNRSYRFLRTAQLAAVTNIYGTNYQHEIATCVTGECPRNDGHEEIIGAQRDHRFGVQLVNFPGDPLDRREALLNLPAQGSAWPHRPQFPTLCLVCPDLVNIVKRMLEPPAPPTGADRPPGWDTDAPTTDATLAIDTPESGWHTEPVPINFSAQDGEGSGVASITTTLAGAQTGGATTAGAAAAETISADGTTTVSYFARDHSGNAGDAQTIEISIDTTEPEVTAATSTLPNVDGWFNSDVVVSFTAADIHSGVASVSDSVVVSTETLPQEVLGSEIDVVGPATAVVGTATDVAGNTGSASAVIRLDKTPPTLSHQLSSPPNGQGWHSTGVLVTFSATDALSGVRSHSSPESVTTEGAGQIVTGTAADVAGNTSTAEVELNIDLTPPAIALESRVPAANAAGWNNTAVTLTWRCTDALSGAVDPTVSASIAGEGLVQSRTGVCADAAQNSASHTQGDVNIDLTNPGVAVASPANGATYLLNAAVPAEFSCTDTLSGVASCAGSLPNGTLIDTSSPGAKTFAVTAADRAANAAGVTHGYSVHYNFTGFATPIRSGTNQVNAGRTVPVKFSLVDANGAFVTTLASFVSLTSNGSACDTGEVFNIEGEAENTTQTTIRYDAAANQFIYNWKTENGWAGSCRNLTLTLADGTTHMAHFRFQ
jgi:pimeloyl-ACP methyl ester carboxylesterase